MGVRPEPAPTVAKHVGTHLREAGIIMGVGGYHKNVMRFQPPLTISRAQLERAVEGLRTALEAETE
jgi:4-aminobutyrate aminotransferase-like enzyme